MLVLPDGCRDLIVRVAPQAAPRCLVSALADCTEPVTVAAGEHLVGVRLQAGAQFDEQALLAQLAGHAHFDDSDLLAAVGAVVRLDSQVSQALQCLAEAPDLALARKRLGLSERSLQRLLMAGTGRNPVYWKNLARARRSARALFSGLPLADLAQDHGYADQAHMARDMRRWFGASPAAMRRNASQFAALHSSGHG